MKFTRRRFLVISAIGGSGLAIGFALQHRPPNPAMQEGSFQPNAWLQICADGRVIFQLDKAEMGQGVYSSLPTLLGEELDFDPARMEIEFAPVYPDYVNPATYTQLTGGSSSLSSTWDPLREAGATARQMLREAAAQHWQLPLAEVSTDDGMLINARSAERLPYAAVVDIARTLSPPGRIALKEPADYRWIGKALDRLDTRAKCMGTAQFGIDVRLPGLLTAIVLRCPQFGGSLEHYDAGSAAVRPGVKAVFAIHSGVAIVAESYWQARKAAEDVQISWHKGPLAGLSSADIQRAYRQALDDKRRLGAESGLAIVQAQDEGDCDAAFAAADTVIEAEYSAPYYHHSPMEPQNCTVMVDGDSARVWAPSQAPDLVRAIVSQFSGIDRRRIDVHSTFMGGGFGRRGYVDYAGEAAAIAAKMPGVPVRLQWSREDDMQHDFYRTTSLHAIRAGIDANRDVTAWQHELVCTSIIEGFGATLAAGVLPTWIPLAVAERLGKWAKAGGGAYDPSMQEGALIPYRIASKRVDAIVYDPGIPTGFWRSVGHSFNAFVVESFVDELAHRLQQDPARFRLQRLADHPRHRAVLEEVMTRADWGHPAAGRAQGVAVHESFNSYAAMVVEVSLQGAEYRVERVVAAVDCGRVVNPDIVHAQIEGAVIYALSAATKAPVTIVDGAVKESNFHDLPVLRLQESPLIESYLIPSEEKPTGIGEIAVPPLAPALANALFAASGQRLREMPLRLVS